MTVNQNYHGDTLAFRQWPRLSLPLWRLCIFCLVISVIAAPAATPEPVAKMDLIAGNEKVPGTYAAALSVTMDARSHTYWRMPGDAGVPPVFDTSGSVNAGKVEVLFPAPARIIEDGLEVFGYSGAVTFPVVVTPADAGKPATLHLGVALAVCGKICIPVTETLEASLPAKPGPAGQAALDVAFAAVPKALPPAHRDDLVIMPLTGAAKPSWTLSWSGVTPIIDIFAEAPDGFVFTTRKDPNHESWTLTALETKAEAPSKWVPVTLTLAAKGQGFFTQRTLDVSAKAP